MIEKTIYDNHQKILVDLLTEISSHYQTISLDQLANRYGYTSNLVGIRNLNSFYTKFKKQYHMMPNDYRKKSYLSDHFL